MKAMRLLLLKAKREDPRIRDCAADIVHGLPGKSYRNELEYIFRFVRDNIRYMRDIVNVETLQTPWETLARGYGDCDDQALLIATLCETIGHRTRFCAVGFTPVTLSHIYAQSICGDKWISMDTTEPNCMGWEPPDIRNRMLIFNKA